MSWRLIEELEDNQKVYKGTLIRFYNKNNAISEGVPLWAEPTDYIISQIYSNDEFFQLICLSKGEEGNIICVLKRQEWHTLGSEIKRMLVSDLYSVFINTEPKISIT